MQTLIDVINGTWHVLGPALVLVMWGIAVWTFIRLLSEHTRFHHWRKSNNEYWCTHCGVQYTGHHTVSCRGETNRRKPRMR